MGIVYVGSGADYMTTDGFVMVVSSGEQEMVSVGRAGGGALTHLHYVYHARGI